MTLPAISIDGNGLGAVTAAASLSRLGCAVHLPDVKVSGKAPYVTLNEKTLWMISNLFGGPTRDDIERKAVSITSRRLLWNGDRIETVPEASLIISPSALATTLVDKVAPHSKADELLVKVRGRSANKGQPVGVLNAFVWNDLGFPSEEADWCATLALDRFWVMLAPTAKGTFTAQVFSELDSPDQARSVVAEALHRLDLSTAARLQDPPLHADAAPRLGRTWTEEAVHMGDECLALDPIAGDGLGHTIRMAFWLTSLICMPHLSAAKRRALYAGRIAMAFEQHLSHRTRFYRSAKSLQNRRLGDLQLRNTTSSNLDIAGIAQRQEEVTHETTREA